MYADKPRGSSQFVDQYRLNCFRRKGQFPHRSSFQTHIHLKNIQFQYLAKPIICCSKISILSAEGRLFVAKRFLLHPNLSLRCMVDIYDQIRKFVIYTTFDIISNFRRLDFRVFLDPNQIDFSPFFFFKVGQ